MLPDEASEMVAAKPSKAMPDRPSSQMDDGVLLLYLLSDPMVCFQVRSAACVADELSWPSSNV